MVPIRRILFPTDFSEYADHAWSFALQFAQEFRAEVHLFHVVAPPPRLTEAYSVHFDPQKFADVLTGEATVSLDRLAQTAKDRSIAFRTEVRIGDQLCWDQHPTDERWVIHKDGPRPARPFI